MKMATFCFKQRLFIRNYPILQQKNFAPDYKKNIARGTTDPWVDTITGGTL